jgi:hypothetical protein
VATNVFEALVIHEAVILWWVRRAVAGSDGLGDESVD